MCASTGKPQTQSPLRELRNAEDNSDAFCRYRAKVDLQILLHEKQHPLRCTREVPDGLLESIQAKASEHRICILRFFKTRDVGDGTSARYYCVKIDRHITPSVIPFTQENIQSLVRESKAIHDYQSDLPEHQKIDHVESCAKKIREMLRGLLEFPSEEPVVVVPTGELWSVPFHVASNGPGVAFCSNLIHLTHHYSRSDSQSDRDSSKTVGVHKSHDTPDRGAFVFGKSFEKKLAEHGIRPEPIALLKDACSGKHSLVYIGCHAERVAAETNRCFLQSHRGNGSTEYLLPEEVAIDPADKYANAPVVILSACTSGFGIGAAGGEVSGFYRGFAARGASAVMQSFWPINDDAEKIAIEFARKHVSGKGESVLDTYSNVIRNSGASNLFSKYGLALFLS